MTTTPSFLTTRSGLVGHEGTEVEQVLEPDGHTDRTGEGCERETDALLVGGGRDRVVHNAQELSCAAEDDLLAGDDPVQAQAVHGDASHLLAASELVDVRRLDRPLRPARLRHEF